jgi:hypothetical protein
VLSTRRLLGSKRSELISFVLAYALAVIAVSSSSYDQLPQWHKSNTIVAGFSAAGWWHMLVSLPLLLVLIFGWMWRFVLWTRLLWLISRLELQLVASHPDHVAGLRFLGHSLRAFSILALALATIPAGRSAQYVMLGGSFPTTNLVSNVATLGSLLALFVAPLLLFSPTLLREWQRASLAYGALASRVGEAFEKEWLEHTASVDQAALEKPDFSAAADLSAVVANVYAIRFVPVDLKDLIVLAVALLLPFVPVLLLAIPTGAILQTLKSLLF